MAAITPEEQAVLDEAERRGLLSISPEEQAVLDEANKRGLLKESPGGYSVGTEMPSSKSSRPSAKKVMEMMGGTAGSVFGAGGTVAGAALGNVQGQLAEQGAYAPIMFGPAMIPGKFPEGGADVSLGEAAKEGAVQGAFDVVGGRAYKALRKPLKFAAETIKPGAKEVAKKFGDLYGGALTYGEQTKSYLGDVMQNIAEKSAFGGETMRKFHELKQAIPLQKGLEKISKELTDTPQTIDEAGDLLIDALVDGKKLKMQALANSWKAMDDFVGSPAVDLNRKVIPLLNDIIEKAPSGGSSSSARAKQMLDYFSKEHPDGITTWERAHIEQSDLFDLPSAAKKMMSSVDKANLTKLRGSILDSMGESAQELGDEAFNVWKSIRKQYATEMGPYNVKFIKKIASTEGGVNIMGKVLSQKSPKQISKLRSLIPESKWNEVQAAWLKDSAEKLVNKEGLFDLGGFTKSIKSMGDSYDVIFKGEQKEAIDHLVKVIEHIGSTGTAGKAGAIFIQMKQSSAVAQLGGALAVGGVAGYGTQDPYYGLASAGIILGGPWVLAKILTNPTATRYLTRTIKTGTGEAIDSFNKFALRYASRFAGSKIAE